MDPSGAIQKTSMLFCVRLTATTGEFQRAELGGAIWSSLCACQPPLLLKPSHQSESTEPSGATQNTSWWLGYLAKAATGVATGASSRAVLGATTGKGVCQAP